MVNTNGGLKSNDLSLKVMEVINPTKWSSQEYCEALDGLVVDGELLELPYIIPSNGSVSDPIRLFSFYFPKGTRIGKEFVP